MIEKIKSLFSMLPRAEQLELLRELTSSNELYNPVVEVAQLSQTQYAQNVVFKISNLGDSGKPRILASLTTPWGDFEGEGINQKIAKVKASENAKMALTEQLTENS